LKNHDASVDSGTDADAAGSDVPGEAAVGPCEEVVGRWWGAEVGVVMGACLKKKKKGLMKGEGAGVLVGIRYEWGAGEGVRCLPTFRFGLAGRPL